MITEATPAQIEAVAELTRAAFEPLRQVYRPTSDPPTGPVDPTCLVLTFDERIVATLSYYFEPPLVRVYRIAVSGGLPSARSGGSAHRSRGGSHRSAAGLLPGTVHHRGDRQRRRL